MRYDKVIQELLENGEISYSKVPPKLLNELLEEELVVVYSISAAKKKLIIKGDEFREYYKNFYEINAAQTRAELVQAQTDTKRKRISPQDGLYVTGNGFVNGEKLSLFRHSALFLQSLPKLESTHLVVGVENFENLIYWESLRYLFDVNAIVFVFRNKKMLKLFEEIDNEIIYFGDFDLAGIAVYEREIKPRNKNIKFFIPKGIEVMIEKYGSSKLYQQQLGKYTNLKSNTQEIQELINTIHKLQKGLEQEFFIKKVF